MNKTIEDILKNAEGEIEVLGVLDGYELKERVQDPRVRYIELKENIGMRGAINAGITESKGDFIMKLDAHCAVGKGFDKIMCENTKENWLTIPSRYALYEINWNRDEMWPARNYHYLSFPTKKRYALDSQNWDKGNAKEVDDVMTTQGSCWVVNKKYFMEHIGLMDDKNYGPFVEEAQEIGLKYWLGGGAMKVVKKTWYAHLSKRKHHYNSGLYTREYKRGEDVDKRNAYCVNHWMGDEHGLQHNFEWLVQKFSPVPTWPADWKDTWRI